MAKYEGKPFSIMAFPCNQFMGQEPGTNAEIKSFAQSKGFSGLLMDKVEVNGGGSSPVYKWLKMASGDEGPIAWNFGYSPSSCTNTTRAHELHTHEALMVLKFV